MEKVENKFGIFMWRMTAAHTVSYFIAGIFAILVLRYDQIFGVDELSFMRPTDSPWVGAGPGLQVLRGLLLSLFLYPFRSIFFTTKRGWLKFWFLNLGLSYLLTVSAAPGSFEGIIYTNIPIKYHLIGIPEILLYITLFTFFLWGWYKKPKTIFKVLSIIFVSLILLMSLMGVLASIGIVQTN
ncbi:hypothetical protein JW935_13475 [candidate division KSB1 bacterium]|nr:hypothetical protein [candidate division KSB1 bacterium]